MKEVAIELLRVIEKAIDDPATTLRLLLVIGSVTGLWILVHRLA